MSSKSNRTYKCPFCNSRFTRDLLVNHVADNHEDELPEDFSPFRYVFHYVNKKPLTYHGICTECKGPTDWDEERGRYKRQCNKKACHDSFVKKFEENMVRTKGTTRISATVEGQIKMLQNRKISGEYKFQNGKTKPYCGQYEKKALEFMDLVLNIDPDDILAPGPILEYTFEGKTHIYITDFYYQPYNLVIEVKDGGKNPNNREMPEYRAKQLEKEKYIIKHTNYNYLRLTDNDFKQLINIFTELKMQMVENTGERVIHVNENNDIEEIMSIVAYAPVIGMKQNPQCVYIRNYMQNNAFSGYCLSDEYKFDKFIRVDDEDNLVKEDILPDKYEFDNHIICIPISKDNIAKKLAPYVNEKVSHNFIYETLFNKKQYTDDQIYTENVLVIPTYEKTLDILSSIVENYILSDQLVSFEEGIAKSIISNKELIQSDYLKLTSESFGLPKDIVKFVLNQLEVDYGQK